MTIVFKYIDTLNPKQVEHIQQSLNELKKEVRSGVDKLKRIESYLYDDEMTDAPGVVKQVRDHAKRIEDLERSESKTRKFLKGLALLAGTVGTIIFEFLKWLFSNHKP